MRQIPGWTSFTDDDSGFVYYVNDLTGESKWAEEMQTVNGATLGDTVDDPNLWVEMFDDNRGYVFYYNEVTGESQWSLPVGGCIKRSTNWKDPALITHDATSSIINNNKPLSPHPASPPPSALSSPIHRTLSMKSQRFPTSPEQQSQNIRAVTLAPAVTIVTEEDVSEEVSAQPVQPRSELEMITRAKTLSMRLEQLLQTNKRLAKADKTSQNQNNNSDSDNDEKTEQNDDGHRHRRDSSMVVSSSGSSSDNESEQPERHGGKKVDKGTIIGKGNGQTNSSSRRLNAGKAENDEGITKQKQGPKERDPQPRQGLEREERDKLSASLARVSFPVESQDSSADDAFASLIQNNQYAGSSSSVHRHSSQSGQGVGGSLHLPFRGGDGDEFGPSAVATTDLTDAASFFNAIGVAVAVPDETQRPPKLNNHSNSKALSSSSAAAAAAAVTATATAAAARGLPEPIQTATAQALGLSAQSTARSSDRTIESGNDDEHNNNNNNNNNNHAINDEPNRSQHLTTAGGRQSSSNRLPIHPSVDKQHNNQRNEEDVRRLVGGGLDDSTLAARILAKKKRAQQVGACRPVTQDHAVQSPIDIPFFITFVFPVLHLLVLPV